MNNWLIPSYIDLEPCNTFIDPCNNNKFICWPVNRCVFDSKTGLPLK